MDQWQEEYVEHLQSFPRLDDTWFPEQLERAKAGDPNARRMIVGSSLWIAWESAKTFEDFSPVELPRLVVEANNVLIDSLDAFHGESTESYVAHVESAVKDKLVSQVLRYPSNLI